MNERIKELRKQVSVDMHLHNIEDIKAMEGCFGFDGGNKIVNDYIEKFAELIVKECIGCCEQVISDPIPELVDTWLNGGEQCIQEIKQHFGLGMSVVDKKQLIKDLLGVNNDTKS